MSTRSNIGLMLDDSTVKRVYCHYDGYPDGVGQTLLNSFNTVEKIEELLSFGDISCLEDNIHPKGEHTFDNPEKGCTVFYGRDRGEDNTEAITCLMQEWVSEQFSWIEYIYLFRDNEWYVKNLREGEDWVSLESAL